MSYSLVNMGVDTTHGRDFAHHLPQGMQFWVFLHMLTPHMVNTGDQMKLATPGTCIVYRPNDARYLYCPDGETSFRNNWVHFLGDSIEKTLLQYKIPIGKFFMLKQTMPIITTLQDLNYEFSQVSLYREQMQSVLIDMLLLQIGRNIIYQSDLHMIGAMQHYQDFEQLRRQMYLNPEREWTIPSMARCVFLGQNRFIALYRAFFNVTPKHDLINARLQKAKGLLFVSLTLREVAQSCGFQNEYYFSTAFKQSTGMTPGQYREKRQELGGALSESKGDITPA